VTDGDPLHAAQSGSGAEGVHRYRRRLQKAVAAVGNVENGTVSVIFSQCRGSGLMSYFFRDYQSIADVPGDWMRLSKLGYYADFFVYPTIILALAAAELWAARPSAQLQWLIACLAGIAGWTLAEYIIHRFAFHRIPLLVRMHDMHHANPSALVGAPLWSSLGAFGLVFIPLCWQGGFDLASGLTAGLMLGYLWYGLVHAAVHRYRLDRGSFLYRTKLRHARHHYGTQEGNFGVTTSLWDHVFGTAIQDSRAHC
jgi:sterol desaturase/sphingolipid hydroxylase (fatty acid hydroxylase superfamily)